MKCRCGSEHTVLYGKTRAGSQRRYCYDCGETFVNSNCPKGSRYTYTQRAIALELRKHGCSVPQIQRVFVSLEWGKPDENTLKRWERSKPAQSLEVSPN